MKKTYSTTHGACSYYGWLSLAMLGVLAVAIIALFYPMTTDLEARIAAEELSRGDKDMVLMQNASDLDARITQEVDARLQNVTNLEALLAVETAARVAKEMILMQNVTDLDVLLVVETVERMQNVSDLDARLVQEEADRVAKDMILMQNVSDLSLLLNMIANVTDANTTTKVTDLMMMIMTLNTEAFTHIEDGYGTDLSISPTPTPSGVGRTLRVDLDVAGSPTITITPSPSPAGTVTWNTLPGGLVTQLDTEPTMGPTWADNICGAPACIPTMLPTLVPTLANPTNAPTLATGICAAPTCAKVTKLEGDTGPPTSDPTVLILGGTHIGTVSSATNITINVNATSVCELCPSGSGGITGLTATVGGTTTASTVLLGSGSGISTTQNFGNQILIANTMSLSADVGAPTTDGADVLITGASGISTSTAGNIITVGNTMSLSGDTGGPTTDGADVLIAGGANIDTTRSGNTITISTDPVVDTTENAHWCGVFNDDGIADYWVTQALTIVARKSGNLVHLSFSRGFDTTCTGYGGAPPNCAGSGTSFYICDGPPPPTSNYANGGICNDGMGNPCTCRTPRAGGDACMPIDFLLKFGIQNHPTHNVLMGNPTPQNQDWGQGTILVNTAVMFQMEYGIQSSFPPLFQAVGAGTACGNGNCIISPFSVITVNV